MRVNTSYIRRQFYTACNGMPTVAQWMNLSSLVLSKLFVYHCLPIVLVPWIYLLPVLES